ncbi:serine hydrolase domain-containing protein [Isosphaeraceae bacterium EP7]
MPRITRRQALAMGGSAATLLLSGAGGGDAPPTNSKHPHMSINTGRVRLVDGIPVEGFAAPEFQPVLREFERNFRERGERGAACAIYHRGVKVVDLWGGYRASDTLDPWEEGTLALVFSASKGMAAAAMTVAHAQGLFDLDERVATYWPEFAAAGKNEITVRQLLSHQAGLVGLDCQLNADIIGEHDRMAEILARQTTAWAPGEIHGYHTLTLGWYQNELIRRVDPRGRSLGTFFRDEIARPLNVEFHIGLPSSVPDDRVATVKGYRRIALLGNISKLPPKMILSGMWPQSLVSKSVRCLGIDNPASVGDPVLRRVEIPSANGIGQARAVAKIYEALASGGRELGLTQETFRELVAPAREPRKGTQDAILKIDTRYHMGFSRPSRHMPFGASSNAFGCPGAGGCFGMGDPDEGLGLAYVTNEMGFQLFDDPREKAVRDACYESLAGLRGRERPPQPGRPSSASTPSPRRST